VCERTEHASAIIAALNQQRAGHRRMLDISTDESTNHQNNYNIEIARSGFEKQGGIINVLAVGLNAQGEADLKINLCTRNGFCISAKTWDDYAEALKRKIITEIA
jgi:hypothetical protein